VSESRRVAPVNVEHRQRRAVGRSPPVDAKDERVRLERPAFDASVPPGPDRHGADTERRGLRTLKGCDAGTGDRITERGRLRRLGAARERLREARVGAGVRVDATEQDLAP